jgi:DNA-binding beta-propeller fold protein YncE
MNRGKSWIWPPAYETADQPTPNRAVETAVQPTVLPRTKRARVGAAALVLPLLGAVAACGPAVAAHGVPVRSAAGRHLLAPAAGLGTALVGSAPVGNGPSGLALDAATHTIYVANGYNDNGPNAGGNTVSVIDARHCQAMDVSRCKGPWPTIRVGDLPSMIAINQATDTVYVADTGANAVSVFNGATCNALVTSGCGQTPATVPVGLQPIGIFADPANHTVYIPNFDNGQGGSTTVSMLNSATCNAAHLAACPAQPPPTVNVGAAPDDVGVDQATHTVYVTTTGAHNGWSVFNADTCNATVRAGCGAIGRLPGDPAGPNAGEVDSADDTLYTANFDNTISAFDLSHCDASDLAGCATATPGTVMPFPASPSEHALWLTVDVPLHSVYVAFQRDDALIVVDTDACNGTDLAGCGTLHPPAARTGAQPESVVLDEQTQTLYTANQTGNDVSVIDASRCNAETTSGCRPTPPSVPITAGGITTDPAVDTLYVTTGTDAVSMVSTQTCNSQLATGCADTAPQVTVGADPAAVAVDSSTHTVYVANAGSGNAGTVSVINATTCNAADSAGCSDVSTLRVPGGNPDDITVDAPTDTVYVATITATGPNLLSVFNGATCNAATTSGCGQKPSTLALGDSGGARGNSILNIAVNQATDTIYATNIAGLNATFEGDKVYVINGATCDAANRTGCSHTPASITPGNPGQPGGLIPWGIAIDPATDTIYVAIEAGGDFAGSVAVIDGATCNGADTAGCGQKPLLVSAGFGVSEMAIDPTAHTIYTTNTEDASLSVIDGARCNRFISRGCGMVPPTVPAGSYPGFDPGTITVDAAVGTAYVKSVFGVSVIPLNG